MGIKQLTPMAEVDAYLEENIDRIEFFTINKLSYVGEQCLISARTTNSYTDRTGNLRSSTGYVIVKNGKIVTQTIYEASAGTDRRTGVAEGEKFLRQIVREFPQGIALIVVAGMNYAGYVSGKGYDVLDSAELLAERLVPQLMKQLGFTAK
jgi:hypothetical protein